MNKDCILIWRHLVTVVRWCHFEHCLLLGIVVAETANDPSRECFDQVDTGVKFSSLYLASMSLSVCD